MILNTASRLPAAVRAYKAGGGSATIRIATGENNVLLSQLRLGDLDFVVGIRAGHDDFASAQVEGHFPAGVHAQCLPDGLGQRDLALGGQRGDFMDIRHGCSPDDNACMVRNFPYIVNLPEHGASVQLNEKAPS